MNTVRVRFAPSPTGLLHIGNVRTALFNYLFARHEQGTFILRIEDTDTERSDPKYSDAIIRDLQLLEIRSDEGPYYQSQRLELYQEAFERLEKQERVYFCYCTREELEARRREARTMKRPPRYDNRCRILSDQERRQRTAQGIRPTVRFKVEVKEPILIQDVIRGEVSFDPGEMGDFVIMRPDPQGKDRLLPTFHLSVCVDDGLMGITHVIRGEDHLSNSPRHVLLFQALGFRAPVFAHLSLIHGPGGEPLSKRYGALSVSDFVHEQGYLPEAIRNYLALLGWSPKDNREVFGSRELEEGFDLRNATRHPAIFAEQKLMWINSEHLKRLPEEDYLTRAFDFLQRKGVSVEDKDAALEVLLRLQKDIHRFDELPQLFSFLCSEQIYEKKLEEIFGSRGEVHDVLVSGRNVLASAHSVLKRLNSSGETLFEELFRELKKEVSEKGKKLYFPIRAALTGETCGMELKQVFVLLDTTRIVKRLDMILRLMKGSVP